MTDKLFQVHMLNEAGKQKAQEIAELFDELLKGLDARCSDKGREWSIVKTKLEEAAFYAKKAMAQGPGNQA